jgi:hypothetical protein
MYITIRPSLNKIKAWHNVKSPENTYSSILVNRGIESSDLDIYKVTCKASSLKEKLNFRFIDSNTKIEFFTKKIVDGFITVTLNWFEIDKNMRQALYTGPELTIIADNMTKEESLWATVPTKDMQITDYIEEEEIIQTICVEKLNPF